jgi:hypothetical protein
MTTVNKMIGAAWETIVDDGDEFFLSMPFKNSTEIFVASVPAAADVAGGVVGHPLRSGEMQEMNRALIGPGEIKARCLGGSVTLSLTTWTP